MVEKATIQGFIHGNTTVFMSKSDKGYSVSLQVGEGATAGLSIHSFREYSFASDYYSSIIESIQDGTLFA